MADFRVDVGDCRALLASMPAESAQTCITSPPYFGLRDYGMAGQIGAEESPEAYVAELVAVFREVRRVLRADGTLWLNLGDSYAGGGGYAPNAPANQQRDSGEWSGPLNAASKDRRAAREKPAAARRVPDGLQPKDMLAIPWRTALALQSDGWVLRSEIIWHKSATMPEAATDRPTRTHEHVFLLAKSRQYFYDADAISEPTIDGLGRRNARTVWTVAPQPFKGAHFATFPPALIEPCVFAGSRVGDVVLDPFTGAGTTGLVALKHQRSFRGVELNPAYADMARARIVGDSPLLNMEVA